MVPTRAAVAIVGGGIIGLSVAYALIIRGVRDVLVLEQGHIGGQASIAYAGLLSIPGSGLPHDPLSALGAASLARFPDLVADLRERSGIDPELRPTGALYLALTADEERTLRNWLPAIQHYDPTCRWLDASELRSFEPALSPLFRGALFAPFEQQVLSPRLVRAYARAAAQGGANIVEGATVFAVEHQGDRINALQTSQGRVAIEQVVLAAGAWSGALSRLFGVTLPVGPLRGQLLRLDAPGLTLRHSLYRGDLYIALKADGTVAIGSTEEEATFDRRPTGGGLRLLTTFATETVPALAQAPVVEMLAGLRPLTADGLPVLGRLPGWQNAFVATGHARNGVVLSAITGAVMADMLTGQPPAFDLRPFDPARFHH